MATRVFLIFVLLGLAGVLVWLQRTGNLPARPRLRFADDRRLPWYTSRGTPGILILVVIGLIALWLLLNTFGLIQPRAAAPPGEFVVRIAPFISSGADQRQGTIVAQQLLAELEARVTTPMNLGIVNTQVVSAEQALAVAQGNNIDVLIWGEVAEGVTASQGGLRPALLWRPNQPFVPRTWQGYDGQFALPLDYDLALQDFNGPAVLAPLLDGINHFSRGDADRATEVFDRLSRDYADVLRLELPAMIRAIVLWAEGQPLAAEQAARTALESANRAQHLNNLGALLLDQNRLEPAGELLLQAVARAPDLPQAHANLGRLLLDQGQPAEALPNLRSAVNLMPNSPPMVATLGEAYRRSGALAEARTAVQAVLALDTDNGPALAEQSMLALTDALTATGQLEWELEQRPSRTAEELVQLRTRTSAGIAAIEELRNEYLRQANAYGVSGRSAMQRLAETQAARLEQELLNRRYQLMLVQIEQGRVLAQQPRSSVRRFWDSLRGKRTPLQEAIATSTAALRQEPNLLLQHEYHYQQGRAAFLSDNPQLARTEFEAAQQLAETAPPTTTLRVRPEAHYGLALLSLDEANRDEARAQLVAALAADERFFPARQQLALLYEQDQQWSDAEQQYRWFVQHRPWDKQYQRSLARILSEQGNLAGAEAELLPLANAGDVDALIQLAALYRRSNEVEPAREALGRALAAAPESAAVHEEIAALALVRNQPSVAEAELRKALELEPSRSSARVALGRLYAYQLNQPGAAAEQFQAAVEHERADPLVYRQLGEVLLEIGSVGAAIDSFERALALAPNSHEAHHGLATAYLAQGRYDAATKAEQRALDLASGNYTLAHVGLGDIAREQGRYEEAVKHYTTALDRDPQLASAYLGLGKAAAAQGQSAIAITHYQTGLDVAPDDIPLLLGLADALLQQNDLQGAREAYRKVQQQAPENAAASAGLGRALWQEGQTDAALDALGRAVQLNPNDAETLLTIGEINASLGQTDAALDAYNRAAAAREEWYEPRFRRGVLLLKLERTDAAIEDLEAAVRLNENFAQAHYWLGRSYRAAGRFGDAARQLQRAIDLQRDYFEARFFLGRTLDQLGRAPEAVEIYTAVIAEAPPNDPWRGEAARELERIR